MRYFEKHKKILDKFNRLCKIPEQKEWLNEDPEL